MIVFIGMGMELVVLEVIGLFAGRWVDQRYLYPGYGTITGALLALIIWVTHLIWAIKRLEAKENKSE